MNIEACDSGLGTAPGGPYTTEQICACHGDPVWEAIWATIREYDVKRPGGSGYSSPTGDDATAIFYAVQRALGTK